MITIYEFLAWLFWGAVGGSCATLVLIMFDEIGILFPDGIKNADFFDWAIGICCVLIMAFVVFIVNGILAMALGLIG
jgi:hypothetical protein